MTAIKIGRGIATFDSHSLLFLTMQNMQAQLYLALYF